MNGPVKSSPTKEQLNASSPEHSVWVSANAGSGKTQVLVDRVIKLLLSGADPASILCITFTKAAAAEMSSRLFSRLSSWTVLDDAALNLTISGLGMAATPAILTRARQLFTLALETPGGLKIQTIHGFCERLLHLFPVEAGLAPGFSVIEDTQAAEIRDSAIATVLRDPDQHQSVAQALREVKVWVSSMGGFSDLISEFLKVISKNAQFRQHRLSREKFEIALKTSLGLDEDKSVSDLKKEAASLDRRSYSHWSELLQHFPSYRQTPTLLKKITIADDPWAHLEKLFLTAKCEPLKQLISKDASRAHPDALRFLEEEQQRFYRLFCQAQTTERIEASGALFEVAQLVATQIEARKRRSGLCDFDDLIERTATLLNGNQATAWVLYKLDKGLNHILVDEAQDTSPAQWQIIRALADEFFAGEGTERRRLRTMFVVGDRKQSIYSFQGADLKAYNETRDYLTARLDQSGGGFAQEKLGLSFRSTQEILDVVDKVFPVADLTPMGLAGSSHEESPHSSARLEARGIVELWPLVISEKRKSEEDEAWEAPVDEIGDAHHRRVLARKIAATLKNWIGRRELAGEMRTVAPGDILILLQSRTGLFPLLLAEMRRLELPVAGADRLILQQSLAVRDVMMFIQWCLLPQDDYALACTLKSPLVPAAVTEAELFELAHGRGTSSLWDVLRGCPNPNNSMLEEFHNLAQTASPASFIHKLLNVCRKRIVGRLGSEAQEATDALLDMAYDFESRQGGGLFSFMAWFEATETTLKREMDQASDQIRVMSVHAAKGLEANIVILPDATYVAGGNKPSNFLHTDDHLPLWNLGGLARTEALVEWADIEKRRNHEERNRLLYVALTRARNELYITGSTSGRAPPKNCWWTRLTETLDQSLIKEPSLINEQPVDGNSSVAEESAAEPSWISIALPVQTYQPRKVNAETKTEAQRRGTALHKLMQLLVDCAPPDRPILARKLAPTMELPSSEIDRILDLFHRPDLGKFWAKEGRSEVEIWSARSTSDSKIMRIDRLVLGEDEVLILDYKSGNASNQPTGRDHSYARQMAAYCHAVEEVIPGRPVRAALLWLETGILEWLQPEAHSRTLA